MKARSASVCRSGRNASVGTSVALRSPLVEEHKSTPSDPPKAGSMYWIDGFPELVREWDYERNVGLSPSDLSAGSGQTVWWTCARSPDHRWRAKPNNRTHGTGCPFCANRRVSITNSLAALFPALAAEWHPTRNGAVSPSDIVATSTRVAWWRCRQNEGHEWHATVRDRTRELTSCPYCSNDRVCHSNSLETIHPRVALEWHPTRNESLSAREVTSGSSRRVWWLCPACGHEWRTSVANRVSRASGCPSCSNKP
jgi:hypothetical protein